MKIVGITSTGILSLLVAVATTVYAQHEPQGEKQDHSNHQGKQEQGGLKPHAQQQQQSEQTRPHSSHTRQQERRSNQHEQAQHQRQAVQQSQREEKSDPRHAAPQHAQRRQDNGRQEHTQRRDHDNQERQVRSGNSRRHPAQEQQRVQHSAWQQHRSQHWESDHRNWQQRGGYRGYRIPDDRYREYFGQGHGFRIYGLPFQLVGGYPRFRHQGYWLSAVDPWPEYWGNDWYDNDDVYVTYEDNGYYLYNRGYPNVGIAISISR